MRCGQDHNCVTLAAGLALRKRRVLLDPQGQCAGALGLAQQPGAIYLLTLDPGASETAFLEQFIVSTVRQDFSRIAGNSTTMAAQAMLYTQDIFLESIARFLAIGCPALLLGYTLKPIFRPDWCCLNPQTGGESCQSGGG